MIQYVIYIDNYVIYSDYFRAFIQLRFNTFTMTLHVW